MTSEVSLIPATLDYEYLSNVSRRDPWNSSATRVLSDILNELTMSRPTVELSRQERIREWLTNPQHVYRTVASTVFSLGIDGSPPLFVGKVPAEQEFEIGRELNELRDLEICPGVLYTYELLEGTVEPVPRNREMVWMYDGEQNLMLLEYVPGATFEHILDLHPQEFAAAILQVIIILWTINHRFEKINYDLHSENFILRPLGLDFVQPSQSLIGLEEKKWIPYQTPIGPRWIRSSLLVTSIDYSELELESDEDPGGFEVTELLSRIHDDVLKAQNKDNSIINAFFLRKILDPLGTHITWSKSKGHWIHKKTDVEYSYQQILETSLSIFDQNLDLATLWSDRSQSTQPHLSYEEIVSHRRPITNIKQLCALGQKFSSRPLYEVNQTISDFNQKLEHFRASYSREGLIVDRLEPILLEQKSTDPDKEVTEYLRAMIAWADDIHRGYSLLRYLKCVSDLPELSQAIEGITATLTETRRVYLTHLPSFRQIVTLYLEELAKADIDLLFTKYHLTSLETYIEVCESVANDYSFDL